MEPSSSNSMHLGAPIMIESNGDDLRSSASSTWSSIARAAKRKLTNFSLIGYTASFLFAAILTIGLIAFCLWIIYLDFKRGTTFSISGWAQTVIGVLIGAWITDRPKFFGKSESK